MKIKIITAVFDYPGKNEYSRCLTALENSIKANAPNVEFTCIQLEPPATCFAWNKPGWHNNHIKLRAYSSVKIDCPTFFVDADTIVLKDLTPLVSEDFDIAIAERPERAKAPFNMGVILFMPTDKAIAFMGDWIGIDELMLKNIELHMEYRNKYSGQNQSSFGFLYERSQNIIIDKYPTKIMNAVEQDWGDISQAFILHVKTRLRDAALGDLPIERIHSRLQTGVQLWRQYEKA